MQLEVMQNKYEEAKQRKKKKILRAPMGMRTWRKGVTQMEIKVGNKDWKVMQGRETKIGCK